MGFLSEKEMSGLTGAEQDAPGTPIPLQVTSSDEFLPIPQSRAQAEVGHRLERLSEEAEKRLGISRRSFFKSASGMAAGFVAMNQTYGSELFAASMDEVLDPDVAGARASDLSRQFVIDVHTHFVRDDYGGEASSDTPFPWRVKVAELGWNPDISDTTLDGVKFENFHKEIYFDSDTKVALLSGIPAVSESYASLTNSQIAATRDRVNSAAGSRRLLCHGLFSPGVPGWLDDLDEAIALQPDSFKGYTIGAVHRDEQNRMSRRYSWRMDSDLAYEGYQKMLDAGITTVCVHKGLFPPSVERQLPHLRGFVDVSDVGQAAKDWPDLNFVIYHAGYRHTDSPDGAVTDPEIALAEFERTGRLSWVSDLAEIPEQYGVDNVYADLGQVFAITLVQQPRICAAMLGILMRGLGKDRVCWGTDAVWTGSPQWQIEGLRRLEIPADMRQRHGFAELGDATGAVKSAILTENNARLYGIDAAWRQAVMGDELALAKQKYQLAGSDPSHLQYGYKARG